MAGDEFDLGDTDGEDDGDEEPASDLDESSTTAADATAETASSTSARSDGTAAASEPSPGGRGRASPGAERAASEHKDEDEGSGDPTRNRPQFPNYLPAELVEDINDRMGDLNAERRLDDRRELEKHKGFIEAVWRHFLAEVDDDELLAYVPEYGFEES